MIIWYVLYQSFDEICLRRNKVSNIAVVLRWYKQQYENEGKKQCCESENNSFASTYILNEKFEHQKLSQLVAQWYGVQL